MTRIFLSAPDVREPEQRYLQGAVASNWIAPAGPDLDQFEQDLADRSGRDFCAGLSSGTAALHLALLACGVKAGDEVLCSTLTFVATANAVRYVDARPAFIDSRRADWNMDPALLEAALKKRAAKNQLPAAVVVVDLYGHCAAYDEITALCDTYGVPLIEDAAEALGASYGGRPAGSFGIMSIFSFNGNKIITASGGGALVTDDKELGERVRYLATQAREPVPHYEHLEVGYNYRLSNLLAAFGRGQLETLDARVARRRQFNDEYRTVLGAFDGVSFLDEAERSFCTHWLTALTIDAGQAGFSAAEVIDHLAEVDIESRPVWKPMHLQPVYADAESELSGVSDSLFANGICLPSGSGMSDADFERVLDRLRELRR